MTRCGIGYDVHRLAEGRKLILGGVEIPHSHGLEGHSDADVLSHAIADALLGAICAGDIGQHFPNTDESIRGISSMDILRRGRELLAQKKGGGINSMQRLWAKLRRSRPILNRCANESRRRSAFPIRTSASKQPPTN